MCAYTTRMEARGHHGMSSPSTPYRIFEIDSCTAPGQHRQQPLRALLQSTSPLLDCRHALLCGRSARASRLGLYPLSHFPSTEEGDSKRSHVWCKFPQMPKVRFHDGSVQRGRTIHLVLETEKECLLQDIPLSDLKTSHPLPIVPRLGTVPLKCGLLQDIIGPDCSKSAHQ